MESIRRQAHECANRLLPVAYSAGTAELFMRSMSIVVDLAIAIKCNYARNSGDPGYGILFEARGRDNAGQFTFFATRRNADRGIVALAISDIADDERAPELRALVQDLCRYPGLAVPVTGKNSWPAIGFTTPAAGEQIVKAVSKFLLNKITAESPSPESKADSAILGAIQRRRGQPEFRQRLLAAYDGRCVITDCSVVEALEAAHIVPYSAEGGYVTSNGLLMRADIHTLFDLHLLSICPDNNSVHLNPRLYAGYGQLEGRLLRKPRDRVDRPAQDGIARHFVTWQTLL
jgi:hypothetical protein